MTAYWIALWLSLAGAYWLIPGARQHVYALTAWTALSLGADLIQFYQIKLFLDFFGAATVTVLTIRDVVAGRYWIGKKACAYLSLSSTAISFMGYGLAYLLYAVGVPQKVFPVVVSIHGWLLCAVFLAAVISLGWGVNVRGRFVDSLRSIVRLLGGHTPLPSAQKAYAANSVRERKT